MAHSFGDITINLILMFGILLLISVAKHFFIGFFGITWKPHWIIENAIRFVLLMVCMQLLHEAFNYPYFDLLAGITINI